MKSPFSSCRHVITELRIEGVVNQDIQTFKIVAPLFVVSGGDVFKSKVVNSVLSHSEIQMKLFAVFCGLFVTSPPLGNPLNGLSNVDFAVGGVSDFINVN